MQIQFERTGGFANIRFAGNFDLDSMPEETASPLKQLLEAGGFPFSARAAARQSSYP